MNFALILLYIILVPFAVVALGLSAALIVGITKGFINVFSKKGGKK